MYIRFFAETAEPELAKTAAAYLGAICALDIAPVRLLTTNHGVGPLFAPFMDHLATPMRGDFINVVCCAPARWTWIQKVELSPAAEGVPAETLERWLSLYAVTKRNVLITALPAQTQRQVGEARLYEAMLTPLEGDLAAWWRSAGCDPRIIPPIPCEALRHAICGETEITTEIPKE